MRIYNALMLGVALGGLCLSSGAAIAQTAPGPQVPPGDATNVGNAADATNVRNPGTGGIGDIVVTARKREENAQTVPVSITNLNAEQLAQKVITKPEDLGRFTPGLVFRIASSSTAANFSLRGQWGSDIILTVAPAVGLYENSGNIPHVIGFNGALFDIARIEVLKGPQGTLYGRNTTGGAINIITRAADYDGDHGYLTVELGNYDSRKVVGAFNVPIVDDKLALRVAGQHWSRTGYGQSLVTGQRYGGDRDDDSLRGTLLFTPTSSIESRTTLEYVHLNRGGEFYSLVAVPAGSNAPTEAGLEAGCATSIGNITPGSPSFNRAIAVAFPACASAAINRSFTNDVLTNRSNHTSFERVTTWHAVEDLTFDLSDDVRLRSITSYRQADYVSTTDFDGSPYQILETQTGVGGANPAARYVSDGVDPIPGGTTVLPAGTAVAFPYSYPFPVGTNQAYHQWTQEFNLTGKAFDDRLSWLAGAFGSYDRGRGSEQQFAFAELTGGSIDVSSNTLKLVSKSWGIFTQDDFKLTDKLSVTGGLRYSKEFQDIDSQPFAWSAVTGGFTCAAIPPAGRYAAPGNNPGNCTIIRNGIRSDGVSYLASINYQITPDILLYAKTSKGYRGGSLQLRAASQPGSKPETATDYEIGLKSEFLDRHLRVNIAGYHTDYNNKQVGEIVPVCTDTSNPACSATQTIIFNAANARINGFEAEVVAVPIRGLTLTGNGSLVDSKYTSYPNAPDANSLTNGTFDATGLPFRDPKWKYDVGARYEHDVGPGVGAASLDWSWVGHFNNTRLDYADVFQGPVLNSVLAARGLLSGRIDYTLPDKGLVFAVSATNLLDQRYRNIFTFSKALGAGIASTAEPRMVYFSITKKFGHE